MQQHLRNNQLFEVVATPDVDVEDAVVVDVVVVVDAVDEDTFVTPPVMQAGPECVFLNNLYFSLRVWNTLGFFIPIGLFTLEGPCIFPVLSI
jgi:hypothetical protein